MLTWWAIGGQEPSGQFQMVPQPFESSTCPVVQAQLVQKWNVPLWEPTRAAPSHKIIDQVFTPRWYPGGKKRGNPRGRTSGREWHTGSDSSMPYDRELENFEFKNFTIASCGAKPLDHILAPWTRRLFWQNKRQCQYKRVTSPLGI